MNLNSPETIAFFTLICTGIVLFEIYEQNKERRERMKEDKELRKELKKKKDK